MVSGKTEPPNLLANVRERPPAEAAGRLRWVFSSGSRPETIRFGRKRFPAFASAVVLASALGATVARAEPASDTAPRQGQADADGSVPNAAADAPATDPETHPVRVWVGITAGLVVGSVAYWVDQDQNVADWDDPSLRARFSGAAWRFDNNNLVVNFQVAW